MQLQVLVLNSTRYFQIKMTTIVGKKKRSDVRTTTVYSIDIFTLTDTSDLNYYSLVHFIFEMLSLIFAFICILQFVLLFQL